MSDQPQLQADTGKGIFRSAALAGLNSPEQLDQPISLIPTGMRLLVGALALIILACLAWAVFGSVPTRVTGRGVLIADEEGNYAIAPVAPGLLLKLFVKRGDQVEVGAKIALVEQKLLSAQLDNAVAHVTRLEADFAQVKIANAAQIHRNDETAKRQLAAIDRQLEAGEVRRDKLRQLVVGYEGMRARGLVSQTELLAREEQYDQTTLELANAIAKKVEVEALAQKKRDDLDEVERLKLQEINLKKAEIEQLQIETRVASDIASPAKGVIREIRAAEGDVVAPGTIVATVGNHDSQNVEVVALLRGETRKRVAVGMDVHIVPDGTKKEEFGSMRGRVLSVTDSDVSEAHVNQILRNPQLTKALIGDGAPLLAWIELFPTTANDSGYLWWGASGPPYKVTIGSVVTVDIIIDQVRPIGLVMPALRKLLSIEG